MNRTIKALLALLLSGAMLFTAAACGSDDSYNGYDDDDSEIEEVDKDDKDDNKDDEDSNKDDEDVNKDDEDVNKDDEDSNKDDEGTDKDDEDVDKDDEDVDKDDEDVALEFKQTATIEETVLYDENDILIKATELTYDYASAEIALVIENNSSEDINVSTSSYYEAGCSVNGYMTDSLWVYCDVAAGENATDTVSISYDELLLFGIDEIADIELAFEIEDTDYNEIDTVVTLLKTSAADAYEYDSSSYRKAIVSAEWQKKYEYTIKHFTDEKLCDLNGLVMKSAAWIVTEEYEYLFLEIENTTNEFASVDAEDFNFNGLNITGGSDLAGINPGKIAVLQIGLSYFLDKEIQEAYGMTEIGSVSFTVSFENADRDLIGEPVQITIADPDVEPTFGQGGEELVNELGVKLLLKDILMDDAGTLRIVMLAENNSDSVIDLDVKYNGFSVNNTMSDFSMYSIYNLASGDVCTAVLSLYSWDLEDLDITSMDQLEEIEFVVEIEDEKYNDTEVTVTLTDFD